MRNAVTLDDRNDLLELNKPLRNVFGSLLVDEPDLDNSRQSVGQSIDDTTVSCFEHKDRFLNLSEIRIVLDFFHGLFDPQRVLRIFGEVIEDTLGCGQIFG